MTAPTVLVWEAAGRPQPPDTAAALLDDAEAVCVMCGDTWLRTAPAQRALGGNFAGHDAFRRPDSDRLCARCLWCVSGRPPATLRMWSIVATPGMEQPPSADKAWIDPPHLHLTSRGDPSRIIGTLADPPDGPWLLTVATSGQKHIVPYAQVNRGGGRWTVRMETVDVTATPAEWVDVLRSAATLRAAKHGPDDVLTGRPTPSASRTADDLAWWREHDARLARYHRSPLLELALWCLTKGTIHDHAHPRPSGESNPAAGRATQLSFG